MRRLGDDVASGCHRSENISSLKLITDTQTGRRTKVAGMSIDAHEEDLAKREIHAEAVKNELARYRKSCDKANLEHQPAPARRRDGTRAALGVWDGLNFLRTIDFICSSLRT